jgi:hypothetical protein
MPDFSDYTGLVPAGTIAAMQLKVRYGDGADGVLKRTKAGDAEGLDFEVTLLEGQYAKQKFFQFLLVKGESDGQKVMADKNLATLKRIVDSGKYLDPSDLSPEARRQRTMQWRDFNGFRFIGEVGVEEGKDGYGDKNVIARVITRDMPQWNGRPPLEQSASAGPIPGSTATASPAPQGAPQAASQVAPPIAKPAWASQPSSPPLS